MSKKKLSNLWTNSKKATMSNYLFDLPTELIEIIYEKKHQLEMKKVLDQLPEYEDKYEDPEWLDLEIQGQITWRKLKEAFDQKK